MEAEDRGEGGVGMFFHFCVLLKCMECGLPENWSQPGNSMACSVAILSLKNQRFIDFPSRDYLPAVSK